MDKLCRLCNQNKQLHEFYKRKDSADGYRNECKVCRQEWSILNRAENASYVKAYDRARSRGKDRRRSKRDYNTPHNRVRRQFTSAVRSGKIIPPDICSDCGARGKIEGHHYDYNLPFDVEWLCVMCHGKRHRKYDYKAIISKYKSVKVS